MDGGGLRLTRTLVPRAGEAQTTPFYLLAVQGTSSGVFHLPQDGMVVIGRGEESDLALADESVSRRHARLIISEGAVRLVDLDSHNGTRVNGEPVQDTTVLTPGDVVSVGEVALVLRGSTGGAAAAPVNGSELARRLDQELARAASHERPLSVAVAQLPPEASLAAPAAAAVAALRPIDVVALSGSRELRGLLPDTPAEEAAARVKRWGELLGAGARTAVASCPDDGADPDALWAAARSRLGGGSAQDSSTLTVGGREILVADPAMVRLYELLRRLARADLPVLVTGETGAGKENAAFAVHAWSPRAGGPFVTLNCAAITESLLESELFGHEKGAFTGATSARAGLLEAAAGGSVFLDEVGELTLAAQAKLLRAIETRRVTRVGSTAEREVDFRVIAATNRVLEDEVAAGRFREDLYFRLSAASVVLPPLRDRPREIPLLARAFLAQACEKMGRPTPPIASSAMRALATARWPGNVRELKNAMEYAAAAAPAGDVVEVHHLPARVAAPPSAPVTRAAGGAPWPRRLADELRELEIRRMREALDACGGVQTRAAELIGMPARTFVFKLRRYGLTRGSA